MTSNGSPFDTLRKALTDAEQHDAESLIRLVDAVEYDVAHSRDVALAHYAAQREIDLANHRAQVENSTEMLRTVIEAAKGALTAALLVNGGAAVAVLALVGNLVGSATAPAPTLLQGLIASLSSFSMGTLFGVAATGTAYFAQLFYQHERLRVGAGFHVATAALGLAAYAAFYFGVDAARLGLLGR